jgi:esterase/lipase
MQETSLPPAASLSLGPRHRPSGLNSRFTGDGLSFPEYVASCRAMLLKAHSGNLHDGAQIVEGNAPFGLLPAGNFPRGKIGPYARGVLLIHGLTDSPYFMRPLAACFQRAGFRVMTVLLPGHGTQPGDLLDVHWKEWARCVAWGAEQLAGEADEIFLGGYSAGAALAVRHSLLDGRVRGLFLYSPALGVSRRAALANLHKAYSWLMPSAQWVSIKPDADIYKYESFPKNGAAQMHALTRNLRTHLLGREFNIPVFAAASADDATVDTSATLRFVARANNKHTRLVYYSTDVAAYPPGIPEYKVEMVDSVLPAQRIANFAHTSIVLPPEDAHYGVSGGYSNCLHYYPEQMEKYALCRSGTGTLLQGEVTKNNLRAGTMRRLMYNPHYAALEASMQRFIGSLP